MTSTSQWTGRAVAIGLAGVVWAGCGGPSRGPAGAATPVYNDRTGQLEALESDTNLDGEVDTRAHMEGVVLQFIEIDRDFDGQFDRWEYYTAAPGTPAAQESPDGRSVLDHADEANGESDAITRWEFYLDGVIRRVEEDVDLDGRVDKWEDYVAGRLAIMSLDLDGAGYPTRRLVYGPEGSVESVEQDLDGDGQFEPVPTGRGGGAP
jgi:hypothetical protein